LPTIKIEKTQKQFFFTTTRHDRRGLCHPPPPPPLPPLMMPLRCRRATAMPWRSLAAAAANLTLTPSCRQSRRRRPRHRRHHKVLSFERFNQLVW
jgi:hypothetical protein